MGSCMALPLAILTTGLPVVRARERRGMFFDMIQAAIGPDSPWTLTNCDATSDDPLPGPSEVAGIIVTGSPARVATRDPWMLRIEQRLREYTAAETPVFGICFGHQLLGGALGGKAGPNPNGREIGTEQLELLRADELLVGIDDEPVVVMTHLDSVTELPPGAVTLARTRLEPNAAIRFAPKVWGVQFHPEMDRDIVGDYIEDRREALMAEGVDPDHLLAHRLESAFGRRMLQKFVREQLRR